MESEKYRFAAALREFGVASFSENSHFCDWVLVGGRLRR